MVNIILLTLGLLFLTIAVTFAAELITAIIGRFKKKKREKDNG